MKYSKLFGCVVIFIMLSFHSDAQVAIGGKMVDASTGEGIILGNVTLYWDGILVAGTETDFDGNFVFRDLERGVYEVEGSYVGYYKHRVTGIAVEEISIMDLEIDIKESSDFICDFGHWPPMIRHDAFTQGRTILLRNSGVVRTSSMIIRD